MIPSGKQLTTNELFQSRYDRECRQVHRFMMWIMIGQFVLGITFAAFLSPFTWTGDERTIHVHVWAALAIGASLSGFAMLWMQAYPREPHTRHVVAIIQMLWSALLIHLSGGRIETHFHIFASLAILSIYRDWKILISATLVVAIDHAVRGIFYPLSVFGVVTESPYRWMEHATWVLFEVAFLAPGCFRLRSELWELCVRQTEIEEAKRSVDIKVEQRTSELTEANLMLATQTAETEKLSLVARYTDNAVIILDAEARIEWVNEGFTRISGYTSAEVLGKRPSDFLHGPETSAGTIRTMCEAIQRQSGFNVQTVNYRKDGQAYWVDIEVRPIVDTNGQVYRYIAIEADATERVRHEKEKSKLNQELLDASRKAGMAEIATGVLHNVGNVLNSLNVSVNVIRKQFSKSALSKLEQVSALIAEHEATFVDYVRDDATGRKLPAYIRRVSDAMSNERKTVGDELEDLLRNVEHIKEIIAVQQSMASSTGLIQELAIGSLIDAALTANKASLFNHKITIEKRVDADVPPIHSDKHQILQILINLIKNAKDALCENETESPKILIEAVQSADSVVIAVEDNGKGIESDKLNRIFQHGFTTKSNGHGFGLHSSANAAAQLGGNVSVISRGLGHGARFELMIPIKHATQKASTTK
ncbi:PAS domain-containing protein [Pirellulaceae bacterium SH467]